MSAQGDDLTLAEAVPLATVLLQRLLADAGVRSLAIKGPAFVELGVRAPKQSNDVDLLIHPDDYSAAGETLAAAGWLQHSRGVPAGVRHLMHSTTFHHQQSPSTVDLHWRFPGLLRDVSTVFEHLWSERQVISLAHQWVTTTSGLHALVIEALNRLKDTPEEMWDTAVTDLSGRLPAHESWSTLAVEVERLGAARTAAPLTRGFGGNFEPSEEDPLFEEWRHRTGPSSEGRFLTAYIRNAPHALPHLVWQQLVLSEKDARAWAKARGVQYRNRPQIVTLRAFRALRVLMSRR